MNKICPKCGRRSIKKDGKRHGKQSYRCRECRHVFQNKARVRNEADIALFHQYSVRKQTLAELSEDSWKSIRTIHRHMVSVFDRKRSVLVGTRLNLRLSDYSSSVLVLDATFFGRKWSETQWGILVAQDGISGDILASKNIFQETLEDYRLLLRAMKQEWYPKPHFAGIDGRNGVEAVIRDFYDIPIQICQSHKIATIDRYLLKHPRIESYRELKRIAHEMTRMDRSTFVWMLETFREKYAEDFSMRELDTKTMKHRFVHPRLYLAYKSLMRDIRRLFVSLDAILIIKHNINTSNRIECVFSHLKPKVKLHRWLSKERRLSLALSLLWRD